jgi:spore maturation protein CgeB
VRFVIFCHSLVSDWNHGNAHFLRGVCAELVDRGHEVSVLEPRGGWSRANLERELGRDPEPEFRAAFPTLASREYDLDELDLDQVLDGADVVIVHEWSDPALVRRVGRHRQTASYSLLFHDTHHRAATAPAEMERFDLSGYDGVLAFGGVIRDIYLERGWIERAWTWHEAADVRTFRPLQAEAEADLVWIGNWGDDERTGELREFVFDPARRLRLAGTIHGVRYPWRARLRIRASGLRYRGWLANHLAPQVFARHRLTVHVPRRPYVERLPGIPTIRPFEALACGIPLVCSPWDDAERLFRPGTDFLVARDGAEMRSHVRELASDARLRSSLREAGLDTIGARHTCGHRVDELLAIHSKLTGAGVTA